MTHVDALSPNSLLSCHAVEECEVGLQAALSRFHTRCTNRRECPLCFIYQMLSPPHVGEDSIEEGARTSCPASTVEPTLTSVPHEGKIEMRFF